MTLLVKAAREGQTIARVTPSTAGWQYVGFAAYRLSEGDVVYVYEKERESCIVVLTGTVDIEAGGEHWSGLGSRDSVFEDAAPYALYVPPGVKTTVRATRSAEVGVASAPAKGTLPVRLIEPAQMKRSTRGKSLNTRYICDILPQTE
ncbi:MAG: 5-deoxy-glucuronate isomerase, partial [Paraburkholderia sp.]